MAPAIPLSSARRRSTIFAILFLHLIIWASPEDGSTAVQNIAAAIRTNNFQSAIELANTGLAQYPHEKRLLTLRGIAQQKLGQDSAAIDSFHQALVSDSDYIPALRGVVQSEYKIADRNAVRDLDHLLAVAPGDKTAHAMRASVAWRQQDCAVAIPHFEAAGEVLDTQPGALEEYAACLVRAKQENAALAVFDRIRRVNPDDRRPLYAIAALQLRLGRPSDALSALQPIASAADPDALALRAAVYEALGDTPRAVESLRQAILLAPERAAFYVQFASLAIEHGSFQVGVDMVSAGLQRLPRSPDLLLARGVLLVQLGRYDEADRDFSKAALLDPRQTAGFGARALSALQADRLDEAASAARASVKAHPNDALSWYVLCEVLVKRAAQPGTPEFSKALSAAQRAAKLNPEFLAAGDELSRLYLQEGQTDAAIAECRRVLSIDSNDETALYRLVRALKKRGSPQDLAEVPGLTTQLAEARKAAQDRESEASRYRLVEPPATTK